VSTPDYGRDLERAAGVHYPDRIPTSLLGGVVLVHNTVRPTSRSQGAGGFRYWLQAPSDRLERCDCGWAAELAEHFRVARPFEPSGGV
jgi:hypothetical protein